MWISTTSAHSSGSPYSLKKVVGCLRNCYWSSQALQCVTTAFHIVVMFLKKIVSLDIFSLTFF